MLSMMSESMVALRIQLWFFSRTMTAMMKCGIFPESQKHIADINPGGHYLMKPVGIFIIHLFQSIIIWPHVGQVIAVLVDDPQVQE